MPDNKTKKDHLLDTKLDRRALMMVAGKTAVTATVAGALAGINTAAAVQAQASRQGETTVPSPGALYDRAFLEGMIDKYLDALAAGDPSRAPFTQGPIFAENNQQLSLGDASWQTINRFGRYRHYFCEPENGRVGVIANAYEHDVGCILVVTLILENGLISAAEQFVIRDPNGAQLYEALGAPDPIWLEPIPPAQRQSRDALEAAAWIYFQALERNDGTGVYPFRDDCERIEHARPTVSQPKPDGYGHADMAVDFVTLKAKAQYRLGLMAFVSRIRDRRAAVVDIERGAVLGQGCYDFDGTLRTIHFNSGQDWSIPPYFRTSRTHTATEAFKVINGSFRYIEMTFLEVPFSTRQVLPNHPPTVSLDYDRTAPPSTPVKTRTARDLQGITGQILDAMVRCCPCDLPLAPDLRYTENGIDVKLGEGLWKTVNALRGYGITLADPETGQGGWFGALNEFNLFALLALRFKTDGGLITEIETVIARPEVAAAVMRGGSGEQEVELKGATFTMFVPPLLADLDPDAFGQPAPALLQRMPARDRQSLTGAVDRYYDAFITRNASLAPLAADCVRRENGVPASHNTGGPQPDPSRPEFRLYAGDCAAELNAGFLAGLTRLRARRKLLVDRFQGLVLDLALLDNPARNKRVKVEGMGEVAVPDSCRAPWTDMHAQLFKIAAGRITYIEDLVRRLPYGQSHGWEA